MKQENYYEEVFARNYDKFTTSGYYDYGKEVAEFKKIVGKGLLLEIGIGTGSLAEILIKEGYEIEAIEPSEPMIKELKKKNLPIKIYKQNAIDLKINKQYDTIYSYGAIPFVIITDEKIEFATHITNDTNFKIALKNIFQHLNKNGLFLVGCQSGDRENFAIGDFYKNKSKRERDIITKIHYFKENDKWLSQTLIFKVWPEQEFIQMMEEIGFKTIGLNKSKTWYVFQK